jgi:hypothetical protein
MTGLSHRFPWYIEALQTQPLLGYCLSRLVRLPTFQSGLNLLNAEQECSSFLASGSKFEVLQRRMSWLVFWSSSVAFVSSLLGSWNLSVEIP